MNQYIRNYTAGGAINPFRLIRRGAVDGQVLQANANNAVLVGVAVIPETTTVAANERVDVGLDRFLPVEYGGAVSRDDPLTSDAQGRAIAAAPAVGANMHIIGYADVAGVSGDVVDVYIRPARIQG